MNVQTPSSTDIATPVDGLFASPPHPLPFAPHLAVRAFVLQRDAGNIVIYSAPGLDPAAADLAALGPVERHYLGHHHEAMFPTEWPGGPVFVHQQDRAGIGDALPVRATFSRRHQLDDDFEVIPIPGHTAGATAFLWDTGEHRLLFTGDSIFLSGDQWVAAVLSSSDRESYLASLDVIRDLEFDVLVPWAASVGEGPVVMTDGTDRRRRISAILDRLWRGEDS